MIKLRILLLHKWLYFSIFLVVLILSLIKIYCFKNYSLYDDEIVTITGYIKDVKKEKNRFKILIEANEKILVTYYSSEEESNNLVLELGDYIRVEGELTTPNNNTIPNTFNYKKYLYYKKIYKTMVASKLTLINKNKNIGLSIKNNFIRYINNNPYLETFILGNNYLIMDEVKESYQDNGISHLFALSGMHVSLLSLILLKLLKKVKEIPRYIIVFAFLLFYGFITGFPASIFRAIIFFILISLNKIYFTNIKAFYLHLFTVSILLLINPYYLFDTGFIYSSVLVGGLIISSKFLENGNYFTKILKTSIIAILFSLPITVNLNYEINIMSILANILFVPLITIIIYPFSLISFLMPFLRGILDVMCNIMNYLSIFISKFSLSIIMPKMSFIVIILYYLFLILFIKYLKKKYLILLFLLITLNKNMYLFNFNYLVYYLDVSQGDSSLIIFPQNKKVLLIDTGGLVTYQKKDYEYISKSYLTSNMVKFLKSLGIKKIDYLILSHGDADHMKESLTLVSKFKVSEVIFNKYSYNNLESSLVNILKNKKIKYENDIEYLNILNSNLMFLNTKEYDNENDNSNVIYFKIYKYKFLYMGDASVIREKDIINSYNLENVDFLKVGHHGSDTSSSSLFINKIKPTNCIISVGKNNKYGHPKSSTLDILSNCHNFRTDEIGSILVTISKKGYKITNYSP